MLRQILCLCALLLTSVGSAAQNYPTRPVSIIVPYAAGGPADAIARSIAPSLTQALGEQVLVENISGAGGTIGTSRAAQAKPDGYRLLLAHTGHAASLALYKKLPYHPLDSFEPIGLLVDVPMALVARRDLPPLNLKQFLVYLKANQAQINFGHAGAGSVSHLCGLLFMSRVQVDLTTIPYKGTAPALIDLSSGQFDFMCDQTSNVAGHIKAGKIKTYGTSTKTRVAQLPNVPTLQEAGLSGFEMTVWYGLYAPKATPPAVIETVSKAMRATLSDSATLARLKQLGVQAYPAAKAQPAILRDHLKAEIARWSPIIQAAGVYAD